MMIQGNKQKIHGFKKIKFDKNYQYKFHFKIWEIFLSIQQISFIIYSNSIEIDQPKMDQLRQKRQQISKSSSIKTRKRYNSLSDIHRLGNFVFLKKNKIGSGSSSTVYKGTNLTNGQPVSIKVLEKMKLKPKLLNLFRNEVKILNQLKHQNILKLIGVCQSVTEIWIVTEYCNQGDLQKLIKSNIRLSQQKAMSLFTNILNGYIQISKSQIIHRDLKPSNILIAQSIVKIADFGFSTLLNDIEAININVGSPIYMSPQCLLGNAANIKNDIFSLGIMLYQMLHGKTPWKGKTIKQLHHNMLDTPLNIDENLDLSENCKRILNKCLSVSEIDRFDQIQLFNQVNKYNQKKVQDLKARLSNSKVSTQQSQVSVQQKRQSPRPSRFSLKHNSVVQGEYQHINKLSKPKSREITKNIAKQKVTSNLTPISFIQQIEIDQHLGLNSIPKSTLKINKLEKLKHRKNSGSMQEKNQKWLLNIRCQVKQMQNLLQRQLVHLLDPKMISKILIFLSFYCKLLNNSNLSDNNKAQRKQFNYYTKNLLEYFTKIKVMMENNHKQSILYSKLEYFCKLLKQNITYNQNKVTVDGQSSDIQNLSYIKS